MINTAQQTRRRPHGRLIILQDVPKKPNQQIQIVFLQNLKQLVEQPYVSVNQGFLEILGGQESHLEDIMELFKGHDLIGELGQLAIEVKYCFDVLEAKNFFVKKNTCGEEIIAKESLVKNRNVQRH